MSDYIKREDALEQFDYYDLDEYLTPQIRRMLMDIPSADVAPVRHAKWMRGDKIKMCDLMGKIADGRYYTCQCCGFMKFVFDEHDSQYNYCPNCGARMDGENDE